MTNGGEPQKRILRLQEAAIVAVGKNGESFDEAR